MTASDLRMYASPGVNYESVTQPVTGNPALMRDIKSALASSGLILYDALSYYMRPNFDLERMLPSLEFTAELGLPYAMAICDDPDWQRQVDNFGRFCDAVANLGMTVSMEAPVTQNAVNTLGKALRVIEEAGRANAVICLIRCTSFVSDILLTCCEGTLQNCSRTRRSGTDSHCPDLTRCRAARPNRLWARVPCR